jgi:hypothetical protein
VKAVAAPAKKVPAKQGAQQWFSNDTEEVIAEGNSPSGDNEEAAAELMERHLPSKLGHQTAMAKKKVEPAPVVDDDWDAEDDIDQQTTN